jgi:hypothetical protein
MAFHWIDCAPAGRGRQSKEEEVELKAIVNAIDAYDAPRWPSGKIAGGKG